METVDEESGEDPPTTSSSFVMAPPLPPGMVSRGNHTTRNARFQKHITNMQNSATTKPDPSPYQASQQQPSPIGLQHLQHEWPGKGFEKGKRHLDVKPMTFSRLLSQSSSIVIPLFQRRYCWTHEQISQWWHDVALVSSGGVHGTHKTMFQRDKKDTLLCIDGQQRLTTCTLLLMAMRAFVRQHDASSLLISKIDKLLLPDAAALEAMKRWAKYRAFQLFRNQPSNTISSDRQNDDPDLETNSEVNKAVSVNQSSRFVMEAPELGWLPQFATKLTPSYIDRSAYFELLCRDHILEAMEHQVMGNASVKEQQGTSIQLESSDACKASAQYNAYNTFALGLMQKHKQLNSTTAAADNSPSLHSVTAMCNKIFRKQIDGFSLMYIELLTQGNVQQVFLWMQEKSVFGMGKLLYNPHPGVDFTPLDLARNLVVSSVMDAPDLRSQMDQYRTCWVEPLEARFGTQLCGRMLTTLVRSQSNEDARHIGDMELKLEEYKKAAPPGCGDAFQNEAPMMIYARFHSYVQQRAMMLEGDANSITRRVADAVVQELVLVGEGMINA